MQRIKGIFTILFSYTLVLLVYGCASGHHETQQKLREYSSSGRYDEAVQFLNASSLNKDKNAQLIVYMEKGLLNHNAGKYQASLEAFEVAKKLVGELFTTRISGKLQSAVSNDNADLYYGEKYEASLIYFYLVLNHYLLFLSDPGPQKAAHLQRARAEVLAWDSFIKSMKDARLGQAIFKDDIMAKIFGGLIHEAMGTSTDGQTALLLYRDALNLFFTNYNSYPSFNLKADKFLGDFDKLPTMEKNYVSQNYIQETYHQGPVRDFLTLKVLQLTKKYLPQEYATWHTQLAPSAEIVETLKQKGQVVTILVQDGLIAEKKAAKYSYPINLGGMQSFAGSNLGLNFATGIEFELPEVERKPVIEQAVLFVTTPSGQTVKQVTMPLVAPLSDMAEQAIKEHANAVKTKTGIRVAAKHVAAIVAAYGVYKSVSEQGGNAAAFAGMAASVSYAGAASAIAASEKADVRFWSTLPAAVRLVQVALPPGEYDFTVRYYTGNPNPTRIVALGRKQVSKGKGARREFVSKTIPLQDPLATQVTPSRGIASEKPSKK
ncbi:MAG: hypothetical protein AABY86_04860 [Bdellovibrionota bacterium]